jgi:hypothetical protein
MKAFAVLGYMLLVCGFHSARAEQAAFRPVAGEFPAFEKAKSYRGELAFVDHANRRGSIRVTGGADVFFRSAPHPFAMLPYGIVRYHGAPADLRNVPLGTMMHVRAFLPPDPTISCVPIVEKPTVDHPAENHVLLLEDEPSYCLREGKVWKLQQVDLQRSKAIVIATLESKDGGDHKASEQKMTLDGGTRIWRGRECLALADLITAGEWPAEGKKSLGGQPVLLGLTWLPAGTWENRVENQFHISDLWLDDLAMQRSAQQQTGVHKALILTRWMPGWVDAVEHGKFGRATITATLFGGMDESLYADFKQGIPGLMTVAENTLKLGSGDVGSARMASRGSILDVMKTGGEPPLGSSGIQIRFETDLILEGIRPGRVIRARPMDWPNVAVPREEYLHEGFATHEERFPTPVIFPKY